MRDFRINFGGGAVSISSQLTSQGLKIKKDCESKVNYFNSLREPLAGMCWHDLITDAEYERIIDRAVKKLATFVEE